MPGREGQLPSQGLLNSGPGLLITEYGLILSACVCFKKSEQEHSHSFHWMPSREMGACCSFASLFLCPHRINSHGASRDGSFVWAAALHPFQMGGSFRIILPSTPTSTAELMRWSRSSAHKRGMGTDLLPLRGKDKHMLQSLLVN